MHKLHNFFLSQGVSIITGNELVMKLFANIEEIKEIPPRQSNKDFAICILISSRDTFISDMKQVNRGIRKLHLTPEIFLLKKNLYVRDELFNIYLIVNSKKVPFFQYYLSCISFFIAMLMEPEGFFCIHGGYIYNNLGGFLITGKTGSGKSTLLFNLARSEPSFITDRYALVYEWGSKVKLMSVFEVIDRFGLVSLGRSFTRAVKKAAALDCDFGKYEKESVLPNAYALDYILFPRISARSNSAICEVSKSAALKRLVAFSSAAVNGKDTRIKAKQLLLLSRLSRQCRSFIFSSGREIIDSPSSGAYVLLKRAIKGNN